MPDIFIMAPHRDDEIIGCYEILKTGLVQAVIFLGEEKPSDEQVRKYFNLPYMACVKDITSMPEVLKTISNLDLDIVFMFPDVYFETHPVHRTWGGVGEVCKRNGLVNVWFYNTNMTAPYIREVSDPKGKREALEYLYPEKADLWKYDHKYFLFEGYCSWIMGL